MDRHFNGFSHELEDFWFELHFNNSEAGRNDIKEKYNRLITEPLTALFYELEPTVRENYPNYTTLKRRCISSMYTDRRFVRDMIFKEYLYLKFKKEDSEDTVPGIYFDMGHDGYSYGFRIYNTTINGMNELRSRCAKQAVKLDNVLAGLYNDGFEVYGDKYIKDRLPELPAGLSKELLNRKNFCICINRKPNDKLYSDELAAEIKEAFIKLKGLAEII